MILTDNGKILMRADGKILAGGYGLSDAKLVARGNWEYGCFRINKPLERNKLYYVFIYSAWGYEFASFLIVSDNNCETPIICRDKDDINNIMCSVSYVENTEISKYNISIQPFQDGLETIFGTFGEDGISDYIEVYELPFKVGETQSNASGDKIKTVEIKGVFEDAWGDFTKEDLLIDYFKNFKFEIHNGNELLGRYFVWIDKEGKLMCYDIFNNTRDLLAEIFYESGYVFYYDFNDSGMFGTFSFVISQTTFQEMYGVDEYDNIKLKLYYVEANELTAPLNYEV